MVRALFALTSAVGAVVAGVLTREHARVASGTASGDGICHLSETFDCAPAAQSAWSEIAGVPIAALGLGFYLATLVGWALRRRSADDPVWFWLAVGWSGAVVGSAFLAWVSATQLTAWCPFCVVLYGVNLVGAGLVVHDARRSGSRPGWTGPLLPMAMTGAVAAAIATAAASWAAGPVAPRGPNAGPAVRPADVVAVDPSLLSRLRAPDADGVGPLDAPIVIVEFSDFQCPFCGKLANELHRLKEAYGDRIRLEFRHYPMPFHAYAGDAAVTAMCAGRQGRFWQAHDLLFANLTRLHTDRMEGIALEAGVDREAWWACVESEETKARLERDVRDGAALGVTGTPTFFINGRKFVGSRSAEELRTLVETIRAEDAQSR